MCLFDGLLEGQRILPESRIGRFEGEPGYFEPEQLWFYGNTRLLNARLAYVEDMRKMSPREVEVEATELVFNGHILVCGVHTSKHRIAAAVPLRWGSPRIVVLSSDFYHHLGHDLRTEPFKTGRLWRYEWDSKCDLAVSRKAPREIPSSSSDGRGVDQTIALIARTLRNQPFTS